MNQRKLLVVIPARGGSKGIPGKNIKPLAGRPLLAYTIDCARAIADDTDICVSTDDHSIKKVAELEGLNVPFLRPAHLAEDTSGTYEVLLHALQYFADQGRQYDDILLLQPTSPLRRPAQVVEALTHYRERMPELLVSVRESSANPYYNLFEETPEGYLRKSKEGNYIRRQDCPQVYEYNGAIYLTSVSSLKARPYHQMHQVVKFVMDGHSSVDLDTLEDWAYVSWLMEKA